jgi:hypothetical protein
MPYCQCGNDFSEARARLAFDCCLECGKKEAAAEIARRARMIAPISHKCGYTYLGSDKATQRQRLLEGSAKTPAFGWFFLAGASRQLAPHPTTPSCSSSCRSRLSKSVTSTART